MPVTEKAPAARKVRTRKWSESVGAEQGASDLSRLLPSGIVYWAPFPRPFGPRRG